MFETPDRTPIKFKLGLNMGLIKIGVGVESVGYEGGLLPGLIKQEKPRKFAIYVCLNGNH